MQASDKQSAQQRVDEVQAFQRELERLQAAGIVEIKPDAVDAVREYHSALIQSLKASFDIDADSRARQLSAGMRIASLLGAVALSAGIFFFFHQVWGYLSALAQMAVLLVSSLGTLALTVWVERRDVSSYFTQLSGTIAFVAFVLNIVMPGSMFNLYPSPYAFLLAGVYGFILAYRFRLKWVLVAGIASAAAFLSASIVMLTGASWTSANERPENLLLIGLLCFMLPLVIRHRRCAEFAPLYRISGLLLVFVPMLFLAFWGEMTYLLVDKDRLEILYQILGFAGTLGVIALGTRMQWLETTRTAMVLFGLFFYAKLFDWAWDFLPKYIFFFIVGLTALSFLFVMRRMRNRIHPQAGGVA